MRIIAATAFLLMIMTGSLTRGLANRPLNYEEVEPRFSPDGSKILFSSDKGGQHHIWIKNVDGKLPRQVTKFGHDMEPNWSPDGKQIVFASYGKTENGPFSIWVINADGTNPKQLFKRDGDGDDQYPAWSPDGQHITFSHKNAIWIMDKDGGNAHALNSRKTGFAYCGQWSPSGQQIAYMESSDSSGYKISIIASDGKEDSLVETGIAASQVRWSADGKSLYYSTGEALWKTGADGKGTPTKLMVTKDGEADFDVSPDGKWAAYDDSGPDATGKIYVKRLP